MDNEALKTANMLAKWLSANDVAIRECSVNMTCDGVAGLTVVNVQNDGSIAIVAEQLDNEMVFNSIDEALKDLPDLFKQHEEEQPAEEEEQYETAEEKQEVQDEMSIAEQIEKIENADQLWEAEQRLTGLIEADKIDEAEAKALKKALRAARAMLEKQSVSDAGNLCVLCGQPIKGHGNNAEPLAKGLCCDVCNKDVLLERLRRVKTTNAQVEDKLSERKDGWHVLSEEGKHLGGPYATKEEALKRLRQVEFFKSKQ